MQDLLRKNHLKKFAKDWIIPVFLLGVEKAVDAIVAKLDDEFKFNLKIIKDVVMIEKSCKRCLITTLFPSFIDSSDWWYAVEEKLERLDEKLLEEFKAIFEMYLDESKIPQLQVPSSIVDRLRKRYFNDYPNGQIEQAIIEYLNKEWADHDLRIILNKGWDRHCLGDSAPRDCIYGLLTEKGG